MHSIGQRAHTTVRQHQQVQLGDQLMDCQQAYQALTQEVAELDQRIQQLKRCDQADRDQLKHLVKIRQGRQQILSWIEIRQLLNQ